MLAPSKQRRRVQSHTDRPVVLFDARAVCPLQDVHPGSGLGLAPRTLVAPVLANDGRKHVPVEFAFGLDLATVVAVVAVSGGNPSTRLMINRVPFSQQVRLPHGSCSGVIVDRLVFDVHDERHRCQALQQLQVGEDLLKTLFSRFYPQFVHGAVHEVHAQLGDKDLSQSLAGDVGMRMNSSGWRCGDT